MDFDFNIIFNIFAAITLFDVLIIFNFFLYKFIKGDLF